MHYTCNPLRLLSFLYINSGRARFPAAFFFVFLWLIAQTIWAGEPAGEKPVSVIEPTRTVADASRSDRERIHAASLLAESQDPKTIETLFAVIRNTSEKTVLRAAMINELTKLPQKPQVSAFLLGRLEDQKEVSEVRAAAAGALGSVGLPESKESLRRASSDTHPQVRHAARSALLTLGGKDIDRAGLLIAVLQDTEQRAVLRAGAARQLGELKDMSALQPLVLALSEKVPDISKPQTPDEFFAARSLIKEHVSAAAARALGQLGGRDAISPLLANVQTPDKEFRTAIFEALAMLKAREAAPAARRTIVSDADQRVRRWAGVILKDAGDKDALPELLIALKDTDPGVRLQVAEAIGNAKDCKTIKEMEEALVREEYKEVRVAMKNAVHSLKESTTPCEADIK